MANHIHINSNYLKKMKILFGKNKFQLAIMQIKTKIKIGRNLELTTALTTILFMAFFNKRNL